MTTATIEIKNKKILEMYDLEKIQSVLEMILLDLKGNFVEFGELSQEEFNNLPQKTKKKFNRDNKLLDIRGKNLTK